MYYLLSICLILLLIIIFYNIYNLNTCENENIDVNKYNINAKKIINQDDKFNIKQYDIINDNIIIHSKYKNELLNLKKYKEMKDKEEKDNKIQKLEQRNQKIKVNSEKLKIYEFKQKIKTLKLNIKSLKLSLKIELKNFLNDYNNNNISSDEIKSIIYNLKKELDNNNKLFYTEIDDDIDINDINEYNRLTNIKKVLLEKKINIFAKFLK